MPRCLILIALLLAAAPCRCAEDSANTAATSGAPRATPGAELAPTGVVRGSLNAGRQSLMLPSKCKIMVIPVHDENTKYGMIDEWQALFVERRLQRAQEEGFDLVVLDIDTYGGSVQACERINRAIAACRVPVVAYVVHNAFSGGALISLGCRAIVMAPGSLIGGAKGIIPFMDLPKDMREKLDSDLRAMVTNLCEANHHPTPIAVGMVNSDVEVIETDDPKNRFMTGDVYDELRVKPALVHKWKAKAQILTLTATEAVNVGLAQGLAADHDELFLGLAVTPVTIESADITVTERVVRFLGHPLWRVLLVIVGLVGLVWELKAPGHGLGYLVFGFCMGIFFWLQIFCDNAGLLEVALFGAGAILVAVELFFLPSFGALGFVGCAMVLVSIILAFLPRSVSLMHLFKGGGSLWEMQVLNEGLKWAAVTIVAVGGAIVTILLKGAALPGLSRMALRTEVQGTAHAVDIPMPASTQSQAVASPLDELIGQTAEVESVLRPAGKVRLGGITYDAVSEGGYIEPHTKVVILRAVSGNLVVRAV